MNEYFRMCDELNGNGTCTPFAKNVTRRILDIVPQVDEQPQRNLEIRAVSEGTAQPVSWCDDSAANSN